MTVNVPCAYIIFVEWDWSFFHHTAFVGWNGLTQQNTGFDVIVYASVSGWVCVCCVFVFENTEFVASRPKGLYFSPRRFCKYKKKTRWEATRRWCTLYPVGHINVVKEQMWRKLGRNTFDKYDRSREFESSFINGGWVSCHERFYPLLIFIIVC